MQALVRWKTRYFSLLISQAFSLITSSVVQFAVIWYMTDVTNSALILALGGLCAFLPQGIIGLFAGAVIDRYNKKSIMIIADAAMAAVCIIVFVVGVFSSIQIWLLFVMLSTRGIVSAFHTPAFLAVTPQIVPEDRLLKCAGYSQSLNSLSLILSPVLAAFLFAALPLQYILLVDVFGAFVAIFALVINKLPHQDKPKTENSIFNDIKQGFSVIRSSSLLMFFLIVGAMFALFYAPIGVLYPLMSIGWFGGTKWQAGLVETVFALGVLIGGLLLPLIKNNKPLALITASLFIMGITLFISGLLPPNMIWVFIVLNFIFGLAVPFYNGCQTACIQKRVSSDFLGRVFAVKQAVGVIAMSIGITLGGILAEIFGVNRWFAVSGCLILILSAISLFTSRKILAADNPPPNNPLPITEKD